MAVGTTNYPAALDDATSLIRAVNIASSTIDTGGVTNVATTVPVVSTTAFAADGIAWCGTEAISYTGKTATSLTGCVRGFDNTTAAAHAAGDPIYGDPAAASRFTVLQNAIIAAETVLGTTNGLFTKGSGDRQFPTTPVLGEFKHGTSASPVTAEQPTVKISRTENITASSNVVNNEQNAGLAIATLGKPTSVKQVCGIFSVATGGSTAAGTVGDVVGINAVGWNTESGSAVIGTGFYSEGRRDFNTGKALGTEIRTTNQTLTAGTYNASGFSDTQGMWITAGGTAQSAVAVAIGLDAQAWKVGIGVTAGAVVNEAYRDDSSATTSIAINGSHTTGVDLSGATISGNAITLGASHTAQWSGRTKISSPADGRLLLTDTAGTSFTRMMFGGTTNAFPALRRSSNLLDVALADDSGYAEVRAAGYAANPIGGNTAITINALTGAALNPRRFSADSTGVGTTYDKSRNATSGSHTIVNSGDQLASWLFRGSDGTSFQNAAEIAVYVDAAPGAGDMPGRIMFSTTTDGGTTLTEAMRINNAQRISIGTAADPTALVHLKAGTATASTAPLKFTAGTLLTTPEVGTIEYTTEGFFFTGQATNGRADDNSQWVYYLGADRGTIGATIADYFAANSGIPYLASASYEITYYLYYTKTTAGTVTYTFTTTTAPTRMKGWYTQTPVGGVGTAGTAQTAGNKGTTATTLVLPATGSLTTAVDHQAEVKVIIATNTAGNIRLRVTESAGTITPLADSYVTVRRLPAGGVGTFVA